MPCDRETEPKGVREFLGHASLRRGPFDDWPSVDHWASVVYADYNAPMVPPVMTVLYDDDFLVRLSRP